MIEIQDVTNTIQEKKQRSTATVGIPYLVLYLSHLCILYPGNLEKFVTLHMELINANFRIPY